MAVYELKTFKDIVDAVREELKIQASDNVTIPRIKRDINMVYLNEVCAKERWEWLRDDIDLTQFEVQTGTCAITQDSRSVTLSALIATSVKGYYFSIDEQVYKISQHTAGSTAVELESVYTKVSNAAANYKIWTDAVPLPSDCREVMNVYTDDRSVPMEPSGLKTFRQVAVLDRKEEGRARYYTVTDWNVPDKYSTVAGAPTVTDRESDGLLKTLTLTGSPETYFAVGDRIEVSGAAVKSYNGRFVVSTIDTSNNKITYTGAVQLYQTTTADTGVSIELAVNERSAGRYRELLVHPSISTDSHNLHIDYIKQATPLEDDADEPLIPLENRIALLYGALHKAWSRERNPEEAARNAQLFGAQIVQMRGDLDESTDHVTLMVSKNYMSAKRNRARFPLNFKRFD